MTDAYRKPSQSPHRERAIELLRQARMFLATADEASRTQAFRDKVGLVAGLVDPAFRNTEDDDLSSTLDQAHRALWSNLNEARELLARAGYAVSGARDEEGRPQPLWAGRDNHESAAAVLAQLEALLPNADFTVAPDAEAEAFVAAQRRRRWLVVYGSIAAAVLLPLAVVLLLALFG